MNIDRRRAIAGTAALLATAWQGGARAADSWPNKPLRILQGGAPGGGSEMVMRALEPYLVPRLGQPLLIESKPGAGGMVAAQTASTAAPDGYTYFVSNVATNAIAPSLYRKPLFDPKTELPAVALVASLTNALAVKADSGFTSVADLVAYMKANPSKAFFGSAGVGTSSHLSGLMFGQRVGVEVSHVPYKGTAANLKALLAGEVLFSIDNLPLYRAHVKAGTLRLLAVTRTRRSDFFPDVPTMLEAGVKDYDVSSWYGVSAATGTPPAIIERFGAEIVSALSDPGVIARLKQAGFEPTPMGPQQYAAFIEAELRKWAPLVELSGARVD